MADVRRFNPAQKRDPNGEWGDGLPGPSLPDELSAGFDLISRVEGSFGTLAVGVDDAGDVSLSFHDGGQLRHVDLGGDEAGQLADAVERLAGERDNVPDDAGPRDVYDDELFGGQDEHRVELLGNGVILVKFGDDTPDPYVLALDPEDPSGEEPDDVQLFLDAVNDALAEVDAGRSRAGGEYRRFNPNQPRDPGGEDGGQWTKSGGGIQKIVKAVKRGQQALDATPAKLIGDGYGPRHPLHKLGRIEFSSGGPDWSASERVTHVKALEGYQAADFNAVNSSLRGKLTELDLKVYASAYDLDEDAAHGAIGNQIELLDDVINASSLTDAIVVSRGTKTGRGIFGDRLDGDLTGFEWTEDAYVSTTANPAIADYFTTSGLLMEITAPAGTRAVNLSGFTTARGDDDEAEILLQRGLRMRVVSDTGPGDPRQLKVVVVND